MRKRCCWLTLPRPASRGRSQGIRIEIYSGKLELPYEALAAGLGNHRFVTTLCPGGKERVRRLMDMVKGGRLDLSPLMMHSVSLHNIAEEYRILGERLEGVLKVAVRP